MGNTAFLDALGSQCGVVFLPWEQGQLAVVLQATHQDANDTRLRPSLLIEQETTF